MTDDSAFVEVEATGETAGEAKWLALRELERLHPGLDRTAVVFEVLSEGERGLLGVGRSPARVIARVPASAAAALPEESELVQAVREVLERIADATGVPCRVEIAETDHELTASFTGSDLGLLIGRHGLTIDAVQFLASAVAHRGWPSLEKPIVVDAAGYRARRRARLHSLAVRTAEEALASGGAVELEPMVASERKVVHLRLRDFPGVETRSEGEEPNRYVVVQPATTSEG